MPTVRGSANVGRKAYESLPKQSGESLHSILKSLTDIGLSAQDEVEGLRDQLKNAHTELNKVRGEKERYENSCLQLKKRVSESTQIVYDLKNEVAAVKEDRDRYKEDLLQSKEDYDALLMKHRDWLQSYTDLKAEHDSLAVRHEALKATLAPVPSPPLADRTKESRSSTKEPRSTASSSTKKENREHRDHREERPQRSDHRESDRGRGRDKDREKREHKEQKAEKERLSKRFEERRPPVTTDSRPPASGGRRQSFIEGWGPGGRSASANPARTSQSSTQTYTSSRKEKLSPPLVPGQPGYGASIPRTPNPLSPTGVYSNSGSSAFTDDDKYEDGNYHAYPIQR